MSKIDLNTVSSGFFTNTLLNDNFVKIESQLNDDVLYRRNPEGEPNQLAQDIDANNFNFFNARDAARAQEFVTLRQATDLVTEGFNPILATTVTVTLVDGQTVVSGTGGTDTSALYINGDLADNGRLFNGIDYTFSGGTYTLAQSYPQGTDLGVVIFGTDGEGVPIGGIKLFSNVVTLKAQTGLFIGDRVQTKGYTTDNDGGQANYIIVAPATGVADDGSYLALAGGQQAELLVINKTINTAQFGAITDNSTDNTSNIQSACDFVDVDGLIINNPFGSQFHLNSLNFTNRTNFKYREDDNLDNPAIIQGSQQFVEFMHNGNAGGAVNEIKVAAGFHPGFILDVITDAVPSNLGGGQTTPNPRSSFLHQVDGHNLFQIGVNEDANWNINKLATMVTLDGVRPDLFTPAINVGDTVVGDTSGSTGIITSVGATDMVVALRTGGDFVVGESLTEQPGGATSDTTVTGVTNVIQSRVFAIIMRNYEQGVGFSVQPDDIVSNHSVGGTVTIGTQTAGGASEIGSLKIFDTLQSPTNGIEIRPKIGSTTEIQLIDENGTLKGQFDFQVDPIFQFPIARHEQVGVETIFLAQAGYNSLTNTPAITSGDPKIVQGTGDPDGVVTAGVGSMFLNTSTVDPGGAGTTLYVKETGAGNTGWVAK